MAAIDSPESQQGRELHNINTMLAANHPRHGPLPLSHIFATDNWPAVAVPAITILLHFSVLGLKTLPWKGPFLRRLTPLEALPIELERAKIPLWKHGMLLLLSFTIAIQQSLDAGWHAASKGMDVSSVARAAILMLPPLSMLLSTPITPPGGLIALYLWEWMLTVTKLFEIPFGSRDFYLQDFRALMITLLLATYFSLPMQRFYPATSAKLGSKPNIKDNSPEDHATLWSFITSSYVQPILSAAADHTLEDEECWNLSPTFLHRFIAPAVQSIQASSLLRQYLLANSFDLALHIAMKFTEALLNFAQPVILKNILDAFGSNEAENSTSEHRDVRAILYLVFLSLLLGVLEAVVELFESWHIRRAYERNRGALMCNVVDKAFRRKTIATTQLSAATDKDAQHQHANVGQVLNLVNGDAYAFSQWIWDGIGRAVVAPLQVALAIGTLYYIVGPSTFASLVACLVVALPLIPLSRLQLRLSRQHLAAKDFRVDLVSELVESIRLLKNFAWEWRWLQKTQAARRDELKFRLRSNLVDAMTNLVILFMPAAMLLAIFFALTKLANQPLTVPVAFSVLAMVAKLSPPLLRLPDAWIYFLRTLVVVRRLESLFSEEDVKPLPKTKIYNDHWQLVTTPTTALWPSYNSPAPTDTFSMTLPSLSFPEKGLVLVTGPSSSGKTFLLQTLLGETQIRDGTVYQPDTVTPYSYCTQVPWLESKTIRDNILFYEPFEPERYTRIVQACALNEDLAQFPQGDRTEIGERGVSLSGGQRMRISLARALYRRSAILLLDDPLAALDAATANQVFRNAVLGIAVRERLVIITSHQTSLCRPFATQEVQLKDGSARVLQLENVEPTTEFSPIKTLSTGLQEAEGSHKFMTEEQRETGEVKVSVYLTYLRSAGWWLWIALLALLIGSRLVQLLTELILKWWGEQKSSTNWLKVFFAISLLAVAVQFARVVVALWASFRAANTLFDRCLTRVTGASQRYFDITPVGRVLNRLVADTSTADSVISSSIRSFLETGLVFLSSVAVIMVLLPSFLPVAAGLVVFYMSIAKGYRHASRDLRRLENKYRSPMFSLIGECFAGLPVVRAFGKSGEYLQQMYRYCDRYQTYDHVYWLAVFWLRFRFDTLGRVVISLLTIGCALFGINQGWSAFAIVQAEAFVQAVHAVVWSAAQLQLDLNAIERINELLHLPPEEVTTKAYKPPAYWPTNTGGIVIENLEFRYDSTLPAVVKDLNLTIPAKGKLAIVGRTGSGKSTLAASLLRVREPSRGTITLDGIDITTLSLNDLRSKLSVVPQEPTLFMGTLRFNLDPMNEHDDEECLRALRLIGLNQTLDVVVAAGGKNFSAGERNLIALARAILRPSNILILDESTANLDLDTDKKVQKTLKQEFSDRICISIAHRVSTIIDFDEVIVMENGKIVQQGKPRNLLNQKGHFRELCIASGDMSLLQGTEE